MLNAAFTVEEAVEIADLVRDHGFKGATFAPRRSGTVSIYHTDNLGLTAEEFEDAALALLEELLPDYPNLTFDVRKYLILMPKL